MRRREFITLLGGAAAAWPLAAHAQQPERVRRVGVLLPAAADDSQFQTWVGAFLQALALLGWSIGRNVRIDTRWATANAETIRSYAVELVALVPDVILAHGNAAVGALLQTTRTLPIVFPVIGDPVAGGFVESLARPGGNATGFMNFDFSFSGKWLEVLNQIAPSVTRVAVLRDPALGSGTSQFAVIQAMAPSLAAQHKLPTVYYERFFVAAGGLISYGASLIDQYQRAASYVDRILKGEKPAELPVQQATKFEMVINLKTANALGLEVPPTLLARADEVIE